MIVPPGFINGATGIHTTPYSFSAFAFVGKNPKAGRAFFYFLQFATCKKKEGRFNNGP
jgi:hypothetical protein